MFRQLYISLSTSESTDTHIIFIWFGLDLHRLYNSLYRSHWLLITLKLACLTSVFSMSRSSWACADGDLLKAHHTAS